MAKVRASMAFEQFAGGMGGFVVSPGRGGLVLRQRPRFRFKPNETQAANAARMKQVSALWASLTPAQADAWHDYAQTIVKTGYDGNRYHPTGHNAFVGLAMKVLQVDPEAEVPGWPPISDFVGDRISVSVSGLSTFDLTTLDFSEATSDEGNKRGTLDDKRYGKGDKRCAMGDQGLSTDDFLETTSDQRRNDEGAKQIGETTNDERRNDGSGTGILYSATGPNSAGVVTELMVQPLVNGLRRPTDRYRLAAFFPFTEEELEHFVPMEPGWYACAWRQVRAATGQMTDWEPVGKVLVN